jgi:hypothetical protein
MSTEFDKLDPALDKAIKRVIHETFVEALSEKSVYDMDAEELDYLFERVSFAVKEKLVEHFKGLPAERVKARLAAMQDGLDSARIRAIDEMGLAKKEPEDG